MNDFGTKQNKKPDVGSLLTTLLGPHTTFGSWIGGELVAGRGQAIELIDPATGETILIYNDAGIEVVEEAATLATKAQQHWWAMSASARGEQLWRCSAALQAAAGPLAELECASAGKPIRDCRVEIAKAAEMFAYYAGWCDKITGSVLPVPSKHLNYTKLEPYGVITQITPWNAPAFTCGWQLAPALAAGNAVLLKPSELTPLSSTAIVKILEDSGLPRGLVNVINGLGHTTGTAAVTHKTTAKITLVGSVDTGRKVAALAAERVVPCLLELGGKSANIIFADAALDQAVVGAQAAIFAAAGQSCVSGSRLLVQQQVYDEVVDRVASAASKLALGLPWLEHTMVGPLQNAKQYRRVDQLVQQGLASGAVACAGAAKAVVDGGQDGYFYQPTVLAQANNNMAIAREEIFGPVLTVMPFDDEAEAISIANDRDFGLAGAVWTNNIGRAHRVADAVKAGTFWVNSYKAINVMSPFGGYRASGYGRSSGYEAILEYSQTKSVWVQTDAEVPVQFGYSID